MISFSKKSIKNALQRWHLKQIPDSDDILIVPRTDKETFSARYQDTLEFWQFYWYNRKVTLNPNDTWTVQGIADVDLPHEMWLPIVQLAYFLTETVYGTEDGKETATIEFYPYDDESPENLEKFIDQVFEYDT